MITSLALLATFLVASPIYRGHQTLENKEIPGRYDAIEHAVSDLGLKRLAPRKATPEELLFCHTRPYIDTVEAEAKGAARDGSHLLSADPLQETFLAPDSYDVALFAVGGVLDGVDAVMRHQTNNVFCIIRPPGHHASQDRGMGFCLFNNVAVAARYAQKEYGIERVLIVDWDVHHGNGTQDIFEKDPSVFYFSIHQEKDKLGMPYYPGTGKADEHGKGEGVGTTLNVPISRSADARLEILEAFQKQLCPAMETFKPNLVVISCGFDAREGDTIGELNLTDEDYTVLTEIVMQIADKFAKGRLISALEGGYNLEGISKAAKAHVVGLMQERRPADLQVE